MTTTTENLPLLMRRARALEVLTGVTEAEFSKAVSAGVLTPVYLVWQVVDQRKHVVCEGPEDKARATAKQCGGTVKPCGRAYFRRAEVLKLANGN